MSPRLLLDQGLPPDAARLLREQGWDAIHVREIGMRDSTDTEILCHARNEDRVCVTLDKDFHDVLAATGHSRPSVILLRWQGVRAGALCDVLNAVWARHSNDLHIGCAVTVTERAMRVRHLPLSRM